jgi:hypothetical protein
MLKSTNSNSSQHLLLYQHPKPKKKIQRKLREFQISILSMEIPFLVPTIPLQAVSHPWATSMTISFVRVGDILAVNSVKKCDLGSE